MSFISISFLIFLPSVYILYWMLSRWLRWQNLFVVLASYLFYGWWDWRFLLLIILTSLSSYATGIAIEGGEKRSRRFWTTFNIVLNLGILAVFKYYDFFVTNLQDLLGQVGIASSFPTLQLILPVGISFYTFQSLSYTIDIYRGQLRATRDITAFFAYISFFPQLVAGPIERATHLLPQMLQPRRFDRTISVDGLRRILWGFFKKMVIADNCAIAVNTIWGNWQEYDGLILIVGMLLFTFQIYGDFSGYSDIAIGTAQLFGIRLCDNFRLPYFSRNVGEFWRRWHISLMTWFRDYVYIPLGGSRGSKGKTICNTMVVFLLSGLWHGANWTFVIWGLYSALLFLPSIIRGNRTRSSEQPATLSELPQILFTFVLVAFGWVIFRSTSLTETVGYLGQMFTSFDPTSFLHLSIGKTALLWCVLLVVIEWLQRTRRHPLELSEVPLFQHRAVRWVVYYILLLTIILFHGEETTFIYFQF